MAKEKYYGTHTIFRIPHDIKEKYGVINHHNQYRIVAKAVTRAAANRLVKELLNTKSDVFRPGWTSETGNAKELALCDEHQVILALDVHHTKYVPLAAIVEEVNRFKEASKKES